MIRKLYHGSSRVIERPSYGLGKPYNDYGRGFYCTENIDMAMEWAVERERNGFANIYEFKDDGLRVLDLSKDSYGLLHWLAILLENRTIEVMSPLAREGKEYILANFKIPYKRYDVITGYRADDSYFSFASDFLNGGISYRQLSEAMYLGKLGMQVMLRSKKAFDNLKFVGIEMADAEKWYPLKSRRDKKARQDYFDSEKNRRKKDDIFIIDIIDEEMKADDTRLR